MIVHIKHNGKRYTADLNNGHDISTAIDPGAVGPNCFHAPRPVFSPVRTDTFVGEVKQGGAVNFFNVQFNPHGNGTHTECLGHITKEQQTMDQLKAPSHFVARLVSVTPNRMGGDRVITRDQIPEERMDTEALIIRTLPNTRSEKLKDLSGTNPPYLEESLIKRMVERDINHLLLDLPSVDREEDGGALRAHRAFWQVDHDEPRDRATITEMVYVHDDLDDGLYLLNLQWASFALDASPSRPILYFLSETTN